MIKIIFSLTSNIILQKKTLLPIKTSSVSTFKINIELSRKKKTSDKKQILKKQTNHFFFSHLQKHVTVSSTSRKIYPLVSPPRIRDEWLEIAAYWTDKLLAALGHIFQKIDNNSTICYNKLTTNIPFGLNYYWKFIKFNLKLAKCLEILLFCVKVVVERITIG